MSPLQSVSPCTPLPSSTSKPQQGSPPPFPCLSIVGLGLWASSLSWWEPAAGSPSLCTAALQRLQLLVLGSPRCATAPAALHSRSTAAAAVYISLAHTAERDHLLGDWDGTPSETVKAEPLSDCSSHPAGAVKWSCPEMGKPEQEVPGGKMEIVLPWTADSSS